MRMSAPSTPHTIRFPQDLYDKVHILSSQSGRTFNGAVIYLLQIGFAVAQKYEEHIQKQIEDENATQDQSEVVS